MTTIYTNKETLLPGTPVVATRTLPTKDGPAAVEGDKGVVIDGWTEGSHSDSTFGVAFLNKGVCVETYRHNVKVDEELLEDRTEDRVADAVKFGDVLMGDNGYKFVVRAIVLESLKQGEEVTEWAPVRFSGWAVVDGERGKNVYATLDAYRNEVVKVYL